MSMESAEGAVALAEMPRPDAYPEAHDCTARPEISNERRASCLTKMLDLRVY